MVQRTTPTAWVGWVYFAGALLLAVGGMQIIAGLVGIFNSDYYLVTQAGLIAFNYTTWGWIDLILGSLVVLTGIGVWAGVTFARIVAVFLTILSALSHIAFMSAYPLWSIIGLVINGFIIYALTMHGSEVREVKIN